MPFTRTIRLWSIAALAATAFALGGCSTQIADMPGVGLPAGTPERPKEAGGYLPVHDLPPERDEQAIKPAELAKIQSELTEPVTVKRRLPPRQSQPRSENAIVFGLSGRLKTP